MIFRLTKFVSLSISGQKGYRIITALRGAGSGAIIAASGWLVYDGCSKLAVYQKRRSFLRNKYSSQWNSGFFCSTILEKRWSDPRFDRSEEIEYLRGLFRVYFPRVYPGITLETSHEDLSLQNQKDLKESPE